MIINSATILRIEFTRRIRRETSEPNGVTSKRLVIVIPMPCPECMASIKHFKLAMPKARLPE